MARARAFSSSSAGHRLARDPVELAGDRLDRLVAAGDVDPGLRVEGAGVGVALVCGEHVVGEPAPLAHLAEEARRHAGAEDRREHLQRVPVGVDERIAAHAQAEVRLIGVLVVDGHLGAVVAVRAGPARAPAVSWASRSPSSSLDAVERVAVETAADADDHARGLVPAPEVVEERLARRGADGLLAADDVPAERLVAVEQLVVHAADEVARRVVVHVHLLDDHALLALDLVGVELRVAEHVDEHVERDGRGARAAHLT